MNNATVQLWYEAALKQISAESYFQQVSDLSDPDQIRLWLIRGNSPVDPTNPADPGDQFVRMVSSQAVQFTIDYEVVDQVANTASGFSATLLKKKTGSDAGRYTLVFRSTEYKNWSKGGDFERDGYDGAGGDLYERGFAIGQLRDMEWYFEQLQAGQLAKGTSAHGTAIADALANGEQIDVVGYSLGAHLATVFTELHPQRVAQTIVFNAAGRGSVGLKSGLTYGETIEQMLLRFEQILADPTSAHFLLSNQPKQLRDAILNAPTPHFARQRIQILSAQKPQNHFALCFGGPPTSFHFQCLAFHLGHSFRDSLSQNRVQRNRRAEDSPPTARPRATQRSGATPSSRRLSMPEQKHF